MKKRIISIVMVALLLTTMLAACTAPSNEGSTDTGTSTETSSDTGSGDTYRIAFLPTDSSATFAAWLSQEIQKECDKRPNYELTILDSKNTLSTQLGNLENCVAQGYDYIILHPLEPDAQAEIVDSYIEQGVPIMMINQSDGGSEFASNVDSNAVEQGSIVAEIAQQQIPENGKVVVLLGPSGNSHSIGRREGFEQVLFEKRPDIEILDEQIADWEKSKGMNFMEDWMQTYPQIDAIISMNDAMALGALEAAKDANRTEGLTAYGVDGLADAVLSIREGGLTATCVQNAQSFAIAGFEIIDKVLAGDMEFEKVIIDGELIDSNNMEKWIEIHTENGQISE